MHAAIWSVTAVSDLQTSSLSSAALGEQGSLQQPQLTDRQTALVAGRRFAVKALPRTSLLLDTALMLAVLEVIPTECSTLMRLILQGHCPMAPGSKGLAPQMVVTDRQHGNSQIMDMYEV